MIDIFVQCHLDNLKCILFAEVVNPTEKNPRRQRLLSEYDMFYSRQV